MIVDLRHGTRYPGLLPKSNLIWCQKWDWGSELRGGGGGGGARGIKGKRVGGGGLIGEGYGGGKKREEGSCNNSLCQHSSVIFGKPRV